MKMLFFQFPKAKEGTYKPWFVELWKGEKSSTMQFYNENRLFEIYYVIVKTICLNYLLTISGSS